jgi:type II secretory pathway component PulF
MVRAGETSGRLGESLDRFVTLADRELKTRQKVMEMTRYPIMVIVTLVLAVTALILIVIPRFASVFSQFNTPLPLPTRILIGIGHYWYIVLGALLVILIMFSYLLLSGKGKPLWDKLKTRIPILSPVLLKVALSRFAYTFVMLNRSGITILDTLEITSTTVDHIDLSKSIIEIRGKIREGRSLTDAMRETGKFTPLVLQMVSVGESSGTLEELLMRVTDYYDQEVENSFKKISVYIEPVLTLFLGIVVLFLALAVFLPWWNMASLFR